MDPILVVLRLLHIVAGVLWVGGAIFVFRFVEPTAKELGPGAGPFMAGMEKRKLVPYFISASGVTVLAGTALFWIDSAGDPIRWITADTTGLAFGVGGLAAWTAFIMGLVAIKPAMEELGAAGAAMREAGGQPTGEMVARVQAAEARVTRLGQLDLLLLGIAVVTMATARYL